MVSCNFCWVVDGQIVTDLNYIEDKDAQADFNFVISHSGNLIEIQGTSEKNPISWTQFEELKNLAIKSVEEIFNICSQVVPPCKVLDIHSRPIQSEWQQISAKSIKKAQNLIQTLEYSVYPTELKNLKFFTEC